MLTHGTNIRRFILQSSPTELSLTCVDSVQRGRAVTGLISFRRNGGFCCNNLHAKVYFLLTKQVVCALLQCLRYVHSSVTKIATIPIETCTSAGVFSYIVYFAPAVDRM